MLLSVRQTVLSIVPPPIDRGAILEKAVRRACGSCVLRKTCAQSRNFSTDFLDNPLDADCRKQGRLVPELCRAREQLRLLQADRKRRQEYRTALAQQYQFLSNYLKSLADRLPRGPDRAEVCFRLELSARSRGKEEANGDRCLAFVGPECSYFVILCDGMGTGLGAARESYSAGKLLRQMLSAGFPPEAALESLNSLLALEGNGAAVSVDLARICLDTGIVCIYKWGAAPSWVLTRRGKEKIGTATPPPGMGVELSRMSVAKLSLRRGEVLVLLSDGVDGEEIPHLTGDTVEGPAGKLAEQILDWGAGRGDDDATAIVLRLHSTGLPTS
jgi:serine phosphatase RsbU (regulator of sigma subunit)